MNRTIVNRRYRIERKIGAGGMAEVFLGHDDLLGRPVAIKSLRPQYAADPSFRARFEREAQAAASFSHPNIIDIYDVGEDRGTPYIVMEYVPGETLKEIIEKEGPFDPDDVAILIEQVAFALDYAHERGFVHRDIKPQNILVDAEGLAKVVDFGIAKGLSDSGLTEADSGLGTVHYISPEQASGLMATPSSDIYSLAVVAYEMLTGRLPFDSDSPVGIALKHINEQPRHPSVVNPAVPRVVGDIVMRALAKDPTKRFPSAGEFARVLNAWRDYDPGGWQPAPATTWPSEATDGARTRPIVPPLPAQRADGTAVTSPIANAVQTTAVTATVPVSGPAVTTGGRRGGAAWAVGVGVLVGLIALIWLGARLSARLGGTTADDPPTPLASVGMQAELAAPTLAAATVTATLAPSSSGPELVMVPNLLDTTPEEAAAVLDAVRLRLEMGQRIASDQIAEGRVARQDPEPNVQVAVGSAVVVQLSSGPASVDLQALGLIGRDANEAETILLSRGLEVERQEIGSASIAPGLVAGLDPSDRARPGAVVTILVSVGDRVQIPREIQGSPLDQAIIALEALGLEVVDQIGVPRATIEAFGIDLDQAGIVDQDVVGIQDSGADFGAWVDRGSPVTLVYYDQQLDGE